jgi:chaperonin GroEL (HSP60 family)
MILKAGANVILTTKGIDDLCLKLLIERNAIGENVSCTTTAESNEYRREEMQERRPATHSKSDGRNFG